MRILLSTIGSRGDVQPLVALGLQLKELGQVISVVYRGCAIPIAWRVLPAVEKGLWKGVWLDLFSPFQGVIPKDWVVIVMADRGLYASYGRRSKSAAGIPFCGSMRGFSFVPKRRANLES